MPKHRGVALALVVGAVLGAVLLNAIDRSRPTASIETVPAAANDYGPVVFYSGLGEAGVKVADPDSGWEFVATDSPKYSRWTSDTRCEISDRAARFPSDRELTTLVGWSLGRLGPVYFLATASQRWGEINTIYLFDPGPLDEMECESGMKQSPGTLLRDWLQSGADKRLVVYAGEPTQRDGGEGLHRYYLSAIDGTDAASRVYNCRVDPKIRHNDSFVRQFIPIARMGATCPAGTRQDFPSPRPPLQVVSGGGTPGNLQPAANPQGGNVNPQPASQPATQPACSYNDAGNGSLITAAKGSAFTDSRGYSYRVGTDCSLTQTGAPSSSACSYNDAGN
ncbi:MAG TPA: hypothetical protein VK988_16780, partial [Acidimicrobiales bacterium]|nr:hypothetical protein [Acidimicrobiales bacterium]